MVKYNTMQTTMVDIPLIFLLVGIVVLSCISILQLVSLYKKQAEKSHAFKLLILGIIFIVLLLVSTFAYLFLPKISVLISILCLSSVLVLFLFVYTKTPQKEPEPLEIPQEAIQPEQKEDTFAPLGQSFLEHVTEALTGNVNLIRLIDYINQTLVEKTNASGGVVFLTDDFDDIIASKSYTGNVPPPYKLPTDLPHKPVRVETNFRYVQFNLGESIFGEVAVSGKPILIKDGTKDSRVFVNEPEEFLIPGSYIVVPLIVKDKVVGVAGISRLPNSQPFNDEDFYIATTLGSYAGAAINNIYCVQEILERADLEREAGIASQIQKTLHPKRLPELPEVSFGSYFNATKGVCGDYYDVILARRDRIALIIADVAGKGIQSSIVMIMLRSILHLVTNTTKSAGTILDWINKGITGRIDMDHYATLSYVNYIPSEHCIEYASAGHQPMLLLRKKTNSIDIIAQKTDPIGIERSSVYADQKLTVEAGDIIILFTDGLIEAINKDGQQFGINSLSQVIIDNSDLTAKEISTEIKYAIQSFIGPANLHDDQTLIVMKIKD